MKRIDVISKLAFAKRNRTRDYRSFLHCVLGREMPRDDDVASDTEPVSPPACGDTEDLREAPSECFRSVSRCQYRQWPALSSALPPRRRRHAKNLQFQRKPQPAWREEPERAGREARTHA